MCCMEPSADSAHENELNQVIQFIKPWKCERRAELNDFFRLNWSIFHFFHKRFSQVGFAHDLIHFFQPNSWLNCG